jgi:copper transport protein
MRRLALIALAALAFPAAASAHATLRSTTPHYGTEVANAPRTIRLHFDQHVKLLPGAVKVLDVNGHDHALGSSSSGTDVIARVGPLARGGYTVRWQGISADSHVVSGVWTFGFGVKAPSISAAYGAGGPTLTEKLVRWLWFLGIALTIGALGLRLVVLRGLAVPLALERRIAVAAGLGAVLALQAGIAAFSLNCEDALQLSFGRFLYGDLSPMAVTRFGRAFIVMTLAFALVLALVYLAWLFDRVVFQVPAFAIALVFAGGLSVSGHDAVDPGSSWLSEVADWLHLSAGALWIGGLATMAVLLWTGAPQLRREAFLRFSRLASVLIAVIFLAGLYLGYVRLQHVSDLWTTGYGRVLLVKSALFAVALGWGALHHFFLRPRLERSRETAPAGIRRSLLAESLVGVAVLLAAAILVDSRPPVAAAARAVAAPPVLVDAGEFTYGLAAAGGSVWVGGLGGSDVLRVDPSSGKVVARVDVGPRVFNLASAPGAVWAVSNALGTAVRIDSRTGKVTARVPVGLEPYDIAWGAGSAWTANAGDGTVSRITGGKVVRTLRVGGEPNGLTVYRGSLYVTDHSGGRVLRIDPATGRVVGRVALPGADWITALGDSLYVSQETNVVTRVDAGSLRVTGRVRVGRNPLGSAVVGGKLWVPSIDAGTIAVVDPATMAVVRRFRAGGGPIVALPAFGHTWVTHSTGLKVTRY